MEYRRDWPMKYKRADILVRRLRDRFATGGLFIMAWANGIPANLCRAGRWDSIGARMASRFGRMHLCWPMKALPQADWIRCAHFHPHLAKRIGANPAHVLPGYEDVWYYLWKERRLPINVDPLERKLDMRKTGHAWREFWNKAWSKSSDTHCRSSANTLQMGPANG